MSEVNCTQLKSRILEIKEKIVSLEAVWNKNTNKSAFERLKKDIDLFTISLWRDFFEKDPLLHKIWRLIVTSESIGIKNFRDIVDWVKVNAKIDRQNKRIIIKGDLDLTAYYEESKLPNRLYVEGNLIVDQDLYVSALVAKDLGRIKGKIIKKTFT